MTLVSSLLLIASLVGRSPALEQSSAPRAIGSRVQTDQTVPVSKGARLDIDDCSGEAIIRTWDRDAVRVRATHTNRTRVRVDAVGQVVRIDTDSDGGAGVADFELTVPVWINVTIEGRACFVDIDGVGGTVSLETVDGDIVLRGLSGTVDAKSVEGQVTLEGGRGRIQLSTVEGSIKITKTSGEIAAESVEGDIQVTDSQASAVELSTVEGTITYAGTLQTSGRYLFTTHEGNVLLVLPENTSATLSVRSFRESRIDSTLPLKQTTQPGRRGQRAIHTLGGGAAQVEIETFEGSVRIRKPGEPQKE